MRSADLTIDVSGTKGVDGPLTVAATVHAPDGPTAPEVVAIAMPGDGPHAQFRLDPGTDVARDPRLGPVAAALRIL
jgi:hypothetical protein